MRVGSCPAFVGVETYEFKPITRTSLNLCYIMYEERFYRGITKPQDLICYEVTIKETDLLCCTKVDVKDFIEERVFFYRHQLEEYIRMRPIFKDSLVPVGDDVFAPDIVKAMIKSSALVGVGPMATVAGAIAEFVGRDISPLTDEYIIENGGDIYISNDYGITWLYVDSPDVLDKTWESISLSATGQYQTALEQNGFIYTSNDYGNTWTSKGPTYTWRYVAMSSDGKIQMAAPSNGPLQISTDYGQTWVTNNSSSTAWGGAAMSSDGKILVTSVTGGNIYTCYNDSVILLYRLVYHHFQL